MTLPNIRAISNCRKCLWRMLLMAKPIKYVNYCQRTMYVFQQRLEADVSAWCNRLLWQILPVEKFFLLQQLEAGSYLKPEDLCIKKKTFRNIFYPLGIFTIHTKVQNIGKQLSYLASVMSCLNLVKCVHSSQPLKHMGISLNKIPAEME